MGILTLLRNAFGRSLKSRAADREGADRLPSQPPAPDEQPSLPEPRQSDSEEHELVSAAFDEVKVPHPSQSTERNQSPEPAGAGSEEKAETRTVPEAEAKREPKPEPAEAGSEEKAEAR